MLRNYLLFTYSTISIFEKPTEMKLSTKSTIALQLLQLLQNWENEDNVYNFDSLQNIQGFQNPKLTDCCYLMNANDAIKTVLNTQFYEIASTGEGGTYALWNYPELKEEPPVVFLVAMDIMP